MKTTSTLVALALGLGLGGSCAAADEAAAGPIPAPPGPYQSSRPYLGADQAMPYYGAMRFPFDAYERPYSGPGRYWAPSDYQRRYNRERFATRPIPPWGTPQMDASGAEAAPAAQAEAAPPQHWQPPVLRPPMWWQPPVER